MLNWLRKNSETSLHFRWRKAVQQDYQCLDSAAQRIDNQNIPKSNTSTYDTNHFYEQFPMLFHAFHPAKTYAK